MKFQDDISNMNTYIHTYVHTYGQAETNMPPHFFKVGGIKSGDTIFTIITLWELSVAMETRVLIRSGQKPNAANPPPPMMIQIKFGCD